MKSLLNVYVVSYEKRSCEFWSAGVGEGWTSKVGGPASVDVAAARKRKTKNPRTVFMVQLR